MSKAILGGTLGSQTDSGGAYALGEIHERQRLEIRRADLRQIAATLTRQLVLPLARLNTSLERVPQLVFDAEEPDDLKLYAESLPKLAQAGLQIPARWAREKLKIPAPQGGEEVLQAAAWAPPQETVAARAVLRGAPAGDAQQRQVEQLERTAQAPLEQMIDVIRRKVDQAQSLEELRDSLLDAWPEMDAAALAEVMAQAFAAAALAGRYEILEGL
jgi:phage gp29-like protein